MTRHAVPSSPVPAHSSPITCLDHDPASGWFVSGGYDGRVIGWADNEARWNVPFDDLVNDVRFSPDGRRVAVAVADRYAFVLDAADGSVVLALGPHGDDVNVVRWLPGGDGLVCVMDHLDPVVRVWSGKDGTWEARLLAGHESGVFGAALDPTGRRVATAAEDRTARVWDLDSLSVTQILAHPGDPEAIDWSPDGTVIATGCDDGLCRLWDPDTGAVVRTLTEARAAVRFVRFSPDGTRLLVGAYDATMREYDTAAWTVLASYQAPMQWERAAVHTEGGVAIGSFGARPVFHPDRRRPREDTFGINALAVRGPLTVVGRDDGCVLPVDAAGGGPVICRHESIVNTVAISPDGTTVASADYRGVIHLSALHGSSVVAVSAEEGGPINSAVWAPDGDTFWTAGYDGVIRQWDRGGRQLRRWAAHHSPIKSLAYSAGPALLIAGSSDGSLSAWHEGELAWRATAEDLVLVNAVAADQQGVVVSASRDLLVRRWDAATGALIEALPRSHTKSVKAIATTDDGEQLLSGAYDGTVVLWQRRDDGWHWRRLLHHGKPGVPAVAFGGGGALSAGWDGSVAGWTLDGTRREVHRLGAATG